MKTLSSSYNISLFLFAININLKYLQSLEKLEAMIANAEKNERNTIENESIHDKKNPSRSKKRDDYYQSSDSKKKSHEKNDTRRDHFDKVFYSKRQSDDNFRKREKEDRYVHPHSSNYRNKDILTKNKYSKKFIKPTDDDVDSNIFDSKFTGSKFDASSSRGWKKSEYKNSELKKNVDATIEENKLSENQNKSNNELNTKKINISSVDDKPEILSDKEMNELAAKIVKAEIMGNLDLAKELQKKLDSAQSSRLNRPKGQAKDDDETVILTKTNSMGFTRPLTIEGSHLEPTRGRRKGQKMETHKDGKRMRYFADDDKYSLQDMFQREKLSTVEDHNEMFAKLASKGVGRDDSARDMDDVFEETARVKESDGKSQARERDRAIKEHKRMERALGGCEWCLDNNLLLRHLIIAIGNKCYLCLPPYESLTMGHCLIIPTFHVTCATLLDEDVWDEIQIFRKSLTNMFKEQDEDVIFFESAMYFKHMPHMVLHCVPMAKETGDLAPIYFKKAIMESEKEWSNNKKIVDLSGKNVRLAVPKGLPYFAVDFGLQPGYAHVIEDEKLFPKNFAQEIIGGMLDLDHSLWRKPRKEKLEQQTKKVIQFTKQWKDFDCTKDKLQC
uniref:Cwf19-like C-terminal domain-containing protein n=1 Tax=Clastoptera arizonana TaxID=38151 RepID=A0A1B6EDH0_9HEMI